MLDKIPGVVLLAGAGVFVHGGLRHGDGLVTAAAIGVGLAFALLAVGLFTGNASWFAGSTFVLAVAALLGGVGVGGGPGLTAIAGGAVGVVMSYVAWARTHYTLFGFAQLGAGTALVVVGIALVRADVQLLGWATLVTGVLAAALGAFTVRPGPAW